MQIESFLNLLFFLLYCHVIKWSLSLLITYGKYIYGYEKKKKLTIFKTTIFRVSPYFTDHCKFLTGFYETAS